MINSHQSFRQYFANIAAQNNTIQSFYFGDIERILNAQRSTMEYPTMWLEVPDISFSDDVTGATAIYSGAFVIVNNVERDDYTRQAEHWDSTSGIAEQIIQYLQHFAGTDFHSFIFEKTQLQNISQFLVDNAYGWRVEFAISAPFKWCADCDDCGDLGQWFDLSKTASDTPYQPATAPAPVDVVPDIDFAIYGNKYKREMYFSYPFSANCRLKWELHNAAGTLLGSYNGLSFDVVMPTTTLPTDTFTIKLTRTLSDGSTSDKTATFTTAQYFL